MILWLGRLSWQRGDGVSHPHSRPTVWFWGVEREGGRREDVSWVVGDVLGVCEGRVVSLLGEQDGSGCRGWVVQSVM